MTETSGRETGEGLTSTTDWHKIDAACVEQTKIAKVQYGKSEWQTSPPRQLEARLLAVFSLPYFFIEREKKKKSASGFSDRRPEKCFWVYLICINTTVAPCSYCLFSKCLLAQPFILYSKTCLQQNRKQAVKDTKCVRARSRSYMMNVPSFKNKKYVQ